MKTFEFHVKKGKNIYIFIKSTGGIDACVVGIDGINKMFVESIKNEILGPIPTEGKGTMMLVLGVFCGDLANVEIEAWME